MRDKIKKIFKGQVQGVNVLSQAGYEKPIRFDNLNLLSVNVSPALVWKSKSWGRVQVPVTLYTIEYDGNFLAEYESEEHAISELKELAKAARSGDCRLFKFAWESQLEHIDKVKARKAG